MIEGKLGISQDRALPNKSDPLPYVFIGDEAYPLLKHLIKPYSRQNLNPYTEYFNSRFSRATRIIECAFGIISAKWRTVWKSIETDENFADNIVKCISSAFYRRSQKHNFIENFVHIIAFSN